MYLAAFLISAYLYKGSGTVRRGFGTKSMPCAVMQVATRSSEKKLTMQINSQEHSIVSLFVYI